MSAEAIHVLNRLAFGPAPGDLSRVQQLSIDGYIRQQLRPQTIPVPQAFSERVRSWPTLYLTPVELFAQYGPPRKAPGAPKDPLAMKAARQRARVIMQEGVQARLYRAIRGPRQLQEVMTDFWFNHFNVFAGKGLDYLWTVSYEQEAIRPHTLGRFRDLLGATAKHPAMLFFLDNWLNTGPGTPGARGRFDGLNENYAREVMELHTLGVNGGYSQRDVTELARIFTGWGLVKRGAAGFQRRRTRRANGPFFPFFRAPFTPPPPVTDEISPTGFFFDASRHDFGDKQFLGHTIGGRGISEGEEALDILARHPATARHLSFQLAQLFVADQPPPALVARLAESYQESDGHIGTVLATLFASREFRDPACYGAKFKTPYQYVVSAVRALGIDPRNVQPLAGTLFLLGMPLYGCPTPDGYKNTQEAWLTPDGLMRRLSFATALGTGHLPLDQAPGFTRPQPLKLAMADSGPARAPTMPAPDRDNLARTLGNRFSHSTAQAVFAAPAQLQSALILGSPEFMRR
ncbi:MAG TPA: DUF1800 domain-containing protein [Candidatus Binataceae bacterium]|nr:DUF1800 domain-containing protein [Candidatus Binataceae bacterium]